MTLQQVPFPVPLPAGTNNPLLSTLEGQPYPAENLQPLQVPRCPYPREILQQFWCHDVPTQQRTYSQFKCHDVPTQLRFYSNLDAIMSLPT